MPTFTNQTVKSSLSDTIEAVPKPEATPVAETQLTDFLDFKSRRQQMLDRVKSTMENLPPAKNDRYTLLIKDIKYKKIPEYTKADHRKAIITGRSLTVPLTGTYELYDNATGQLVNKAKKTLMQVPYLTDYGSFVRDGTEYVVRNQFRLASGVFVHRSNDGYPEAQVNVKPRTGVGFRIYMEPETSLYYMKMAGRKVMLYPVLKEMGVTDEQMQQSWGAQIWKANSEQRVPAHTVKWLEQARAKGEKYSSLGGDVQDDDDDARVEIPDFDETDDKENLE